MPTSRPVCLCGETPPESLINHVKHSPNSCLCQIPRLSFGQWTGLRQVPPLAPTVQGSCNTKGLVCWPVRSKYSTPSANIYYAVVGNTTGGTTTFGTPLLLQAGTSSYHRDDSIGRNRWGDYSNTAFDPADPNIFWTFQEWASGASNWSVQITELITHDADEFYWAEDSSDSFAGSSSRRSARSGGLRSKDSYQ